jgi:hypothetical protein
MYTTNCRISQTDWNTAVTWLAGTGQQNKTGNNRKLVAKFRPVSFPATTEDGVVRYCEINVYKPTGQNSPGWMEMVMFLSTGVACVSPIDGAQCMEERDSSLDPMYVIVNKATDPAVEMLYQCNFVAVADGLPNDRVS